MSGTLREILASFFVEVDDQELLAAGKHVEGFIGKLRAVIPVMTEAFALGAIGEFVHETIEAGARTDDLANKLGVGVTELQQFQYAAKLGGVEAETAAHSLGFLNKSVGEALLGSKEAQETFQKMGIAIRDSSGHARETGDILDDVSDSLSKMPDQQTKAAYAMKLFGREGQALLPVLGEGSEKLKSMRAEFSELGGGMSEDFVKQAKETSDQVLKLQISFEAIKTRIVGAMLPAVTWLTEKAKAIIIPLIAWLDHSEALKSGLSFLSIMIAGKLIGSIVKLMRVLGFLKATAWETLKAFVGFAVPLVLIGLLYLAFDDFFTLLDGGDSEIGHLLEGLGGVEGKNKYVDDLKASWQLLLDLFGIGGPAVDGTTQKVSALTTVVQFLAGAFYEIVTVIKLVLDGLVGTLTVAKEMVGVVYDLAKAFETLGSGNVLHKMGDILSDAGSKIGKTIDRTGDAVVNDAKDIWNPGNHPATVTAPGDAALNAAGPDKGPGNATVGQISYGAPTVQGSKGDVSVGKIEVHVAAGKNAEETGKRVANTAAAELQKTMRDAHSASATL